MITSITFDDISPDYMPTGKFESLLDFLSQINIPCTFFAMPGRFLSFEPDFRSCLNRALDLGHEISLHGCKHTKNEFCYSLSAFKYTIPLSIVPLPTYDEQKNNIEHAMRVLMRATGVRPSGFRAPFYLMNSETLRALSNLNFKYDSSKTVFKPVNSTRLRVRWSRDCRPHRLHSLIEIPVTGDYTYYLSSLNFSKSLEGAVRDFEWTMSRDGVFVINIHADCPDINLLGKFLLQLCKNLDGRTEFSRLVDIECNR